MRITRHARDRPVKNESGRILRRSRFMAPTHALIFVAALTPKKIALNYNELIPSNGSRGIRNPAMRVVATAVAAATRISNENSHFCTHSRQGEYTEAGKSSVGGADKFSA